MSFEMLVTAIYKLPSIKHIFFVISSNRHTLPKESEITREDFEHILLGKDCISTTNNHSWTTKIIQEIDFLASMRTLQLTLPGSSNLSFQNSLNMERLTINLLNTPTHLDPSFNTPRVLTEIPDDDVIEVFI